MAKDPENSPSSRNLTKSQSPRSAHFSIAYAVKLMTPFESAAWAILTQGTWTSVAHTLKTRLTHAFAARIGELWAFPGATDLTSVLEGDLASCLGNRQKAAYLTAAARAFTEVDERWLREAPQAEVRAWLRGLPDIGPWSALFILMRGLRRGEDLFEWKSKAF